MDYTERVLPLVQQWALQLSGAHVTIPELRLEESDGDEKCGQPGEQRRFLHDDCGIVVKCSLQFRRAL